MAIVASEKESRFMAIVNDNRRMLVQGVLYVCRQRRAFQGPVSGGVGQSVAGARLIQRRLTGCPTWLYRTAINTCVTYFRHNGKHDRGKVGLDTLAAAIGEDAGTIEDVYEPYLIQNGFLNRTPRGRMVTDLAYRHFGLEIPS